MLTNPNPDKQRIHGHRLGFSQLTQNPVSALIFLSYQPDLKTTPQGSEQPIAAVLAEIGGAKYDQIHILDLVEQHHHNRIELSKQLLKKYSNRPYSAVYADIETLKWFNWDLQFTNLAEAEKDLYGWKDSPGVMAVNRYQLKDTPSQQAEATSWQATILDQVESMRDSTNHPVLRYPEHIKKNPSFGKFSIRGKSTAVDALAGACYVMLSIADDLRWQFLNHQSTY
jgi:hypothetical protein